MGRCDVLEPRNGLFGDRNSRFPAVILLLSFLLANAGADTSQAADKYGAAGDMYLKNIAPVLYDYSQTASEASASLIPLQSEPPEKCAEGFGYYKSIFSSLELRLSRNEPPSGLESVYRNSLEAITDYETGLELYARACMEKDFDRKNRFNIRAGEYLDASVGKIREVHAELGHPVAAGTQAVKKEIKVFSETPINGGSSDEEPEGKSAEELAEGAEPLVTAERGAVGDEAAQVSEPVAQTQQSAAPESSVEGAATPEVAVPEPEKGDVNAPEDISEGSDEQAVAGSAAEAPSAETPEEDRYAAGAQTVEPGAEYGKSGGEDARGEMSREERIAKLNEMIMRGRSAGEESPAATTAEPAAVVSPSSEIAVRETGGLKEETTKTESALDDVNSWCVSGTDTEAELESCINSRAEAKERINNLIEAHPRGSPERDIVEKCKADWKDGNTYNYDMVVSCIQFFCAREQIESCRRLRD